MAQLRTADGGYPADIAIFQKRLALRLQAEGLVHPHIAAAVLAMRGDRAQSSLEFAEAAGVVLSHLEAAQAGKLSWSELSIPLKEALRGTPGLHLQSIRDSATAVREP